MTRFTLHTYENNSEFNKIYEELEREGGRVYGFNFDETGSLLEDEEEITIDISALVENVRLNPMARQPAIQIFNDLHGDCRIIVRSDLANDAMSFFNLIFDDIEQVYDQEDIDDEDGLIPFERKNIYTYKDGLQLEKIIDFADENRIPFTNFTKLSGPKNEKYRLISTKEKRAIVDITTVARALQNLDIVYLVEQFFETFHFYDAIIREDIADEALETYQLLFSSKKPVSELLEGISFSLDEIENDDEDVIKVTDLNSSQLDNLYESMNSRLFGHTLFKMNFKTGIDNFIVFNKINEKKVFSIFLLGNSGLGKTEVARIINDMLNDKSRLAKISFGNYSSQDALNSLIGSPRGYIGSESGELSEKINNSKAGIILCDEFEKTTRPVFNFFLELLEEGVFTDSMSREYDLDGYVIVFTSNINRNQFLELIPPELQSRFDLISEFHVLSREDKKDFAEDVIELFLEKLRSETDIPGISVSDINYLDIVDGTDNLRDVKRILQQRILNKIKES